MIKRRFNSHSSILHRSTAQAKFLLAGLCIAGGVLIPKQLWAQTASPAGSIILNQATGSFTDPLDNNNVTVESNLLEISISEVAGITISNGGIQDDGEVNPGDVISYDFTITNIGNEDTLFFLPDAPASVTNGTFNSPIQLIEFTDGSGGTVDLTTNNSEISADITVPSGGATTGTLLSGLTGITNGMIPANGTLKIRVPVTVNTSGLSNGDSITVVMGNTTDSGSGTQNQPDSTDGANSNEVRTVDPTGTTADDPVNGEREASISQATTVAMSTSSRPSLPPPACHPEFANLEFSDLEFSNITPSTGPIQTEYLIEDVGTFAGTPLDLRVTFNPAPNPGNSNNVPRVSGGQNLVFNTSSTTPVTATYEFLVADTNTPTPINGIFRSGDIDQTEGVEIQLADIDGYNVNAPSNLIITDDGTTLTVDAPAGARSSVAEDTLEYFIVGRSSFSVLYRTASPNGGHSLDGDLGLALNAVPCFDYGDAPDTGPSTGSGNYNTLQSDNGPRHSLAGTSNYLGSGVTPDRDAFRDGTDQSNDASDDGLDDGVQLSGASLQGQSLIAGNTVTFDISATGSGVLNAWIDWNSDGIFDDATETIANNADVSGGTLSVTVPSTATVGTTYARFRYSSDNDLEPTGSASDGEVEDYAVAIAAANDCSVSGTSDSNIIPFISAEVEGNSSASRTAVDGLDDAWRTAANLPQTGIVEPWFGTTTRALSNNESNLFSVGGVNVSVALVNTEVASDCDGTVNTNGNPELSQSNTLQGSAPRPASLNNTSNQPSFWNETPPDGNTSSRNAVLFTFDQPVSAFGAWFGDLETRTINGTAATLRLLDVDGNRIGSDIDIEPTTLINGTTTTTINQSDCGSTGTNTGCGNASTRWVGFVDSNAIARVHQVLVIVGDDDLNDSGNSEHLSFIGANLTVSTPDVLLIKRITAINGDRIRNPNDDTPLNQFVDDTVSSDPGNDNDPGWPTDYLVGELNAGVVKPGDTIEYTVYFLNTGDLEASDVRICDRIQSGQAFQVGIYNNNDGQLQLGDGTSGNLFDFTAANDALDRAQFIPAGEAIPANCNINGFNDNGTLVIDLTGTTGSPTLENLPSSTGVGTPNNSYGFFRFSTQVDE